MKIASVHFVVESVCIAEVSRKEERWLQVSKRTNKVLKDCSLTVTFHLGENTLWVSHF